VRITGLLGGDFVDGQKERRTDRPFKKLNIYLFHDNFRPLIEETIKDLYYSNDEVIYLLKLSHIDRALFKFREAEEKQVIHHTKNYFRACLKSAVIETTI